VYFGQSPTRCPSAWPCDLCNHWSITQSMFHWYQCKFKAIVLSFNKNNTKDAENIRITCIIIISYNRVMLYDLVVNLLLILLMLLMGVHRIPQAAVRTVRLSCFDLNEYYKLAYIQHHYIMQIISYRLSSIYFFTNLPLSSSPFLLVHLFISQFSHTIWSI